SSPPWSNAERTRSRFDAAHSLYPQSSFSGEISAIRLWSYVRFCLVSSRRGLGAKLKFVCEGYRAIAPPSARFDVWANSPPALRSRITNVLFSPSVDHGPRDTSLNSTKRQSVTSVSLNPR